ncbi:MAG: methyltransferase domain-containing protein [Candidatus Omnitrophica bacterium]|nr:methyltransferase domain-containing protein [Candidatus Omnitrophota bacterium]
MIIDNGLIAGNICNKYESGNPIVRHLTNRFLSAIKDTLEPVRARIGSVTEAGCGEGYLSTRLSLWGYQNIKACDVSPLIIEQARSLFHNTAIYFYAKSIYNISTSDSADLMVCCEVLEHLEDPRKALEALCLTAKSHVLLSVPREPLWRALNVLRGKYLGERGNTPGHLNHWSVKTFRSFAEPFLNILDIRTPTPWIILLGTPRKQFLTPQPDLQKT